MLGRSLMSYFWCSWWHQAIRQNLYFTLDSQNLDWLNPPRNWLDIIEHQSIDIILYYHRMRIFKKSVQAFVPSFMIHPDLAGKQQSCQKMRPGLLHKQHAQCKIASHVPTLRTFVSIVLDGCHGGFKLCQLGPHGDPFMILAALHDIACAKLSECFLLGGWSQSRKHTCAPCLSCSGFQSTIQTRRFASRHFCIQREDHSRIVSISKYLSTIIICISHKAPQHTVDGRNPTISCTSW